MATESIVDAQLTINNVGVPVVPNSIKYTEGEGEATYRTQSIGNGRVETVFSQDMKSKYSTLKFEVYNTLETIEFIKTVKLNRNNNAATLSGVVRGKEFSRAFNNAAIINNYEVGLGADTSFEIEMHAEQAI